MCVQRGWCAGYGRFLVSPIRRLHAESRLAAQVGRWSPPAPEGSDVTLKGTKCTLASVRTFPSESQDGPSTLLNEQVATGGPSGHKANELFEQGTSTAWGVEPGPFIRWFTDGERRYGKTLWKLASVSQSRGDNPEYRRRKVWREGLEVA